MATSYSNTGGSGDRTAIISVSGVSSSIVDGVHNTLSPTMSFSGGNDLVFDFGSGNEKTIDEFRWWQAGRTIAGAFGTWLWLVSNNGVQWIPVGSPFSLPKQTPDFIDTSGSPYYSRYDYSIPAPATGYRWWRFLQVGGGVQSPFVEAVPEIEFKIDALAPAGSETYPGTYDTGVFWNDSDKSGVDLSNGNLTATGNTTGGAGVRANRAKSIGKYAYELFFPEINDTNKEALFGVVPASQDLTAFDALFAGGANAPGVIKAGLTGNRPLTNVHVMVLVDFADRKIRYQATSDAGTGPWRETTGQFPTGELLPVFMAKLNGTDDLAPTANFGASAFTNTLPRNYKSWDENITASGTAPLVPQPVVVLLPEGVSGDGNARYTLDGATWGTSAMPLFTNGSQTSWTCLAFAPSLGNNGDGRLVAMAGGAGDNNNDMAYSDDAAQTWTGLDIGTAGGSYEAIAWSDELGLFCAVGGSGLVSTSPDGITWTKRTAATGLTTKDFRGVAWSPSLGLFAAISNDGNTATSIMTSPDGVTWTAQTAPAVGGCNSICWAAGLGQFFAIGFTSGHLAVSDDGVTWTDVNGNAGLGGFQYLFISFNETQGVLLTVGGNGGEVGYSVDGGFTWTKTDSTGGMTSAVKSGIYVAELGLWFSCENSHVVKSSDLSSWTSIAPTPNNAWKALGRAFVPLTPTPAGFDGVFLDESQFNATISLGGTEHDLAATFQDDGGFNVATLFPLHLSATFTDQDGFVAGLTVIKPAPPIQSIVVVVGI